MARAGLRGERGQSSVEAALLLPVALVIVALLVQPVCVLYTRSVMASAAADVARLAATASDQTDMRAFALRRLSAVPAISVFHDGGPQDWEVRVEGAGTALVTVEIRGRVRPLPLLGVAVAALGEPDGEGVVLSVRTEHAGRASWIGGGYGDWVKVWG